MGVRLAAAAPLCAFDEEMTVVAWNEAAEDLTGIPSDEAVGQPCWAVLAGRDDGGGIVCHPGCAGARLAREGRPPKAAEMSIRCRDGRRRVRVETVSAHGNGSPLFLHLIREAPMRPATGVAAPAPSPFGHGPHLTPRQLDVLHLMAEGVPARKIAKTLWLTEATVRNHIRAVLVELDAHSQLEAVFHARTLGLL
jgi:PAS domain S-box-containing protein